MALFIDLMGSLYLIHVLGEFNVFVSGAIWLEREFGIRMGGGLHT